MVENTERKKGVVSSEFLRAKIDLPSFQLEIVTRDPTTALTELRKILEHFDVDEDVMYEEFVQEELRSTFSDSFIKNPQVMAAIKTLLKQEEDYRVARVEIPSATTIDVEAKSRTTRVERRAVQEAVARLTTDVEGRLVKNGIVHISGDLDKDSKILIVDHIHKLMPAAQLRAFQSNLTDENVVLECIFFGDFPEREEE